MDWIKNFVASNKKVKDMIDNSSSKDELMSQLSQNPSIVNDFMESFKRSEDPIYSFLQDGDMELENHNIKESIINYNKALKLAISENDERVGVSLKSLALAHVHFTIKLYEEAIQAYLKQEEESYYSSIKESAKFCSQLCYLIGDINKYEKYWEMYQSYDRLHKEYLDS
jgi:predicted negative regulator of RcsB-dependent stress response